MKPSTLSFPSGQRNLILRATTFVAGCPPGVHDPFSHGADGQGPTGNATAGPDVTAGANSDLQRSLCLLVCSGSLLGSDLFNGP